MSRRIVTLLLLAWSSSVLADAPALLPIHGQLNHKADGIAAEGAMDVTFALYASPSGGGAPIYSERQSVTFDAGRFSAYVGQAGSLSLADIANASELYVGIDVNNDGEMSPRLRLATAPYAAFAQYCADASTLQGLGADEFAQASHQHNFQDLAQMPTDLADGDADSLAQLGCSSGQVVRFNGSDWVCSTDTALPQGAVMFFSATVCPSGWSVFSNARGRAMVGLNTGGGLGAVVGLPLSDQENRTHIHNVDPPTTTTSSESADHTHPVDPPTSSSNDHSHVWATYDGNSNGTTSGDGTPLHSWGSGMNADGTGYYPMMANDVTENYTFKTSSDKVTVDIPVFSSGSASSTDHAHDVNVAGFSSGAATHQVPYVQLLACIKD